MRKIIIRLFLITIVQIPVTLWSQKGLHVNGLPADSGCAKITTMKCDLDTLRTNEFWLDSVKINNNCIDFFIVWSGGCGWANLELITDLPVKKTSPQQVSVFLKFDDKDNCKAAIRSKVSFNIGSYKKGDIFLIKGTKYKVTYEN